MAREVGAARRGHHAAAGRHPPRGVGLRQVWKAPTSPYLKPGGGLRWRVWGGTWAENYLVHFLKNFSSLLTLNLDLTLGTYDCRFGVEKYELDLIDKLMIFSSIQSQEGF